MVKGLIKSFALGGHATPADYAQALGSLLPQMTPKWLSMLRFHYRHQELKPAELARAVGYNDHPMATANLQYGMLGRILSEHLRRRPEGRSREEARVNVLAHFEWPDGHCHWVMWQSLARALEKLEVVDTDAVGSDLELMPGEMPEKTKLREGAVFRVAVNSRERNPEARRRCIAHYGTSCFVCGFNFKKTYGLKEDFIIVHHIQMLAEVGRERTVDPVKDLRPVCANCHSAIHLKTPPYTIEELKWRIRRGAS